jgi:hypothetical protein
VDQQFGLAGANAFECDAQAVLAVMQEGVLAPDVRPDLSRARGQQGILAGAGWRGWSGQ